MRFTTLPREIMLRRIEDTPKLTENYPKSWKALTKKIKQTPSKKAQSLADLGKREKEFTANIDLIKKFNPRLENNRLTLPSPLKQTLIEKSSCQKSSCSYENHQGYQIVFTKNKAGQLVAHIKDKISQGTIVDKKTGKSAKEIPVMVDEGIKDPIAFLIESTHREDTYRACFYPGYEGQDPTVVIGFSAAGLKGGVGAATVNDLREHFRELTNHMQQLNEASRALIFPDSPHAPLRLTYDIIMNRIGEQIDILQNWQQNILFQLNQPYTDIFELIQEIIVNKRVIKSIKDFSPNYLELRDKIYDCKNPRDLSLLSDFAKSIYNCVSKIGQIVCSIQNETNSLPEFLGKSAILEHCRKFDRVLTDANQSIMFCSSCIIL